MMRNRGANVNIQIRFLFLLPCLIFSAGNVFVNIYTISSCILRIIGLHCLKHLKLPCIIFLLAEHSRFLHHEKRCIESVVAGSLDCLVVGRKRLVIFFKIDIAVTFKRHGGSTYYSLFGIEILEIGKSSLIVALLIIESRSHEAARLPAS